VEYTATVPTLSTFTQFLRVFQQNGFDPNPASSYGVFAPNDDAWQRLADIIGTTVGGPSGSEPVGAPGSAQGPSGSLAITPEVDVLLAIGLYHYTLDDETTPEEYLANRTAQTALGDFTGYNVSLYFAEVNGVIQVEGIPFGNSAPLDTPTKVCTSVVYEINQVMIPSNRLSDIPGFTQIIAAQAPGSGQALPPQGSFNLPIPPDTESISVTATGAGSPDGSTGNSTTDINGDRLPGAPQEAPAPGTVNITSTTPAPTSAALRQQPGWPVHKLAAVAAAVVAAMWL